MKVTREQLVRKLADYLNHRLTLEEFVAWSEDVMFEGDFEDAHYESLRDAVSRIGLGDAQAFGLTWEDCNGFLRDLGYQARVEVTRIAS